MEAQITRKQFTHPVHGVFELDWRGDGWIVHHDRGVLHARALTFVSLDVAEAALEEALAIIDAIAPLEDQRRQIEDQIRAAWERAEAALTLKARVPSDVST